MSVTGEQAQIDTIEVQKDICGKIVKNLVSCVDTVILFSQEIKETKFNSV